MRFAIGNTEIISNKKENCDKTFEQIGISFNCSLIVVIFDCDETKGFDGPECVLTTKKEVKVIEQSNIKSQRHPSIESSATQSSLGKRDMVEVIEIEDSPVPVKSSKIEIPLQPNGTEIGSSVIDLT